MVLGNNYNIKSLTTPAATGGTITTSGNYRIHTFTSSGTLIANKSMTVEALVVGGGGGGGGARGAGGGAGGYIYNSSLGIQNQTYTITVGSGGTGGISGTSYRGQNGSNSSIGNLIVALGGGGGGEESYVTGFNGGSGGGSAAVGTGGLTSDPTQGNNGGNGVSGTCCYAAGGGGGAGAVGGNATSTVPGSGGTGLNNSISGTLVGYAGGGAGSYYSGSSNTLTSGTATHGGGLGGVRINDASGTAGSPGIANTGGGGGGGFVSNSPVTRYNGGTGGSGIVIIRYLSSEDVTATNMTITPSENPCRAGVGNCTITANVTWTNNNPTSTSSFTPAITASSGTVSTQPPQNLGPGVSVTLAFTVSGMTAGTCTICPSPN